MYWFVVDPTVFYLSSFCSELKFGSPQSKNQNITYMTIFDKDTKAILRSCQNNKFCYVWCCSEVVKSADGFPDRTRL